MKAVIGLALGQVLIGVASACIGGFVPAYHYYNISQNPNVSQEDRDWALFHYNHANSVMDQRQSAPSTGTGESFAPNDDDGQYTLEQDETDAEALQEEEAALENADQADADPDIVEPNEDEPGPDSTNDSADANGSTVVKRGRANGEGGRRSRKRQAGIANRFTYTNNRGCQRSPPNNLARKEGSRTSEDQDVNLIFDGIGYTDNLFRRIYGRNNQNGQGGAIHGVAHYCVNYANAFWDGVALFFGDGDGRFFRSGGFVRSLDVIGHEYTHGVIQFSNPLYYYAQSGALNEHISDVFGVLTDQYYRGQSASQATWLLGAGLINGGAAFRSMRAPGTAYRNTPGGSDQQVASMAQYYGGGADNQGVHINSGIPNRAFYLFATAVGGVAWETPGRIWYDVLVGRTGRFDYRGETFQSFAQRTLAAADARYGASVAQVLRGSWQQVGVL